MEKTINEIIEFIFLANGVITIPIFSTMLVILFKVVSYKGEPDSNSTKTMFNVGLELATTGIFILLTNISFAVKGIKGFPASNVDNGQIDTINVSLYHDMFMHGTKIILYIVFVLIFSLGIRFFAWNKTTNSMKNTWPTIIIIDIAGMLLLGISILFIGDK